MDINFKFELGQQVSHPLGFAGTVINACVSRTGEKGYWIEYVDKQGGVREVYAPEQILTA